VMTCTLSVDHRVVDGALGAQWLREFKRIVADPLSLLL
jgi:pyruvate dehydrogenase E2 component (dihydrolipoamide acetyltransferase)